MSVRVLWQVLVLVICWLSIGTAVYGQCQNKQASPPPQGRMMVRKVTETYYESAPSVMRIEYRMVPVIAAPPPVYYELVPVRRGRIFR